VPEPVVAAVEAEPVVVSPPPIEAKPIKVKSKPKPRVVETRAPVVDEVVEAADDADEEPIAVELTRTPRIREVEYHWDAYAASHLQRR
jgi:hypothetical protein